MSNNKRRQRARNRGAQWFIASSADDKKPCWMRGDEVLARSERFELPTLGFEVRCSIQLSYERVRGLDYQTWPDRASALPPGQSLLQAVIKCPPCSSMPASVKSRRKGGSRPLPAISD